MQTLKRIHHEDRTIRLEDGRILGLAEYGDPAGQPLLYFHGGVSSRLDIKFASPLCAEKGIRLIAPDRPGTGLSCPNPRRNLLDWANDVETLLDELEIESLPILGWSLAGPFALACAFKTPERISKVGTVGGASPFTENIKVSELGLLIDRILLSCPPQLDSLLSAGLRAAGHVPSTLLKWSLVSDLKPSPADHKLVSSLSTEEATHFIKEAFRSGSSGVMDDYRAVRDWGFALHHVDVPVHLWHGEQDILCPLSMAFYLAERLPKSVLHIVPQSGHFLLRNNLEAVLDTMMS